MARDAAAETHKEPCLVGGIRKVSVVLVTGGLLLSPSTHCAPPAQLSPPGCSAPRSAAPVQPSLPAAARTDGTAGAAAGCRPAPGLPALVRGLRWLVQEAAAAAAAAVAPPLCRCRRCCWLAVRPRAASGAGQLGAAAAAPARRWHCWLLPVARQARLPVPAAGPTAWPAALLRLVAAAALCCGCTPPV